MRKIISSIDIGSAFIKLVVGEFVDNHLNILYASKLESDGIDNCKIIDKEKVKDTIKRLYSTASQNVDIDINRVVLGINAINAKLIKSTGIIKIKREDKTINGDDIASVIQNCADGKVDAGFALIGVIPIEFAVDGDRFTKDPKGLVSENLGLKGIVFTAPKDYLTSLISVTEEAGIKVVDIIPNSLGDYYSVRSENTDEQVGAVINLGEETTSISIFNKGIIVNSKIIKIGAKNIVKDIGFISKVDDKTSRAIYRDIALATPKLANPNEYRALTNLDGKEIRLNQYEISEIAESRITEILNLAKKQINILTKKEISYIIITGGLTELKDFNLILEEVLGNTSSVKNLEMIGVRDNSYSSSVGILKYFNGKVNLRGKVFSLVYGNETSKSNNIDGETNSNTSLIDKVFGYFFDS